MRVSVISRARHLKSEDACETETSLREKKWHVRHSPSSSSSSSSASSLAFMAALPRCLDYVAPGSGRDLSLHKAGEEGFRKAVDDFTASLAPYDRRTLQLEEKVVIVGETQVGKSCLLQRFIKNSFPHKSESTIGLDFHKQLYTYAGLTFTLSIWDTAGQERFQSSCTNVYRGALACIGAFDLGMPLTLPHVKQWVEKVRKENLKSCIDEFCVFLVGCKEDMYHAVSITHVQNLAADLKAEYFEVSAKSGFNVKALFDRVACVLFERALVRQMREWKTQSKKTANLSCATIYACELVHELYYLGIASLEEFLQSLQINM